MNSDLILSGLNEPQRQAVTQIQGPALILAGAGSGKTKALTHRIANMIAQGIPPWQILAVTFTNKAANEMKQRIKNLLHQTEGTDRDKDDPSRLPTMGTFHSVCVRILRRDIHHLGRDRSFVIYDTDDAERVMKSVLRDIHIDEKEIKAKAALGHISRFKSEALAPRDTIGQATTARMQQIVTAYGRYQSELAKANAVDFDDLILETVRLFHEAPEVLARYQETWRYLHVDEYQDTNHAQYLIVSLLAQKYRNVCVIGDPDQSIYAFRGADIRNIMEFKNEYSDALEIKLEQNYRSAQPILTASNAVISANPNRPEKQMWTQRTDGPAVVVQETADERKEAEEVVRRAQEKKREGMPLNDQAVLYRTNAQSRLVEEACLRAGLPYRILGGLKFYARREVKDILGYLSVLLNPADTVSLLRIINVPSRKLGQTTLQHLQEFAAKDKLTLWEALTRADEVQAINGPTRERIHQFVELIAEYRVRTQRQVVSEIAESLLSRIDMEQWLKDEGDDGDGRWENVRELLSVMHKYDSLEPRLSLSSFLEEAALVSEVDKLNDVRDDALTLMTLHLCKGLEFEHVMMVGCEEGIFPHSNSLFDKAALEEERRLMYVGMTRARTYLALLLTRSRTLWGQTQANAPSRFLDDLPDEVTERRSDEVLSAFAWASERGERRAWTEDAPRRSSGKIETPAVSRIEPFRQHSSLPDVEFNQDTGGEEMNQDQFSEGVRVRHPSFGEGTILTKRGDIVNVQFDSGQIKTFALSIAPLKEI